MALQRDTDTSPLACEYCLEAIGVNLGGTVSSADLGGSSKYSNENFEDRSGEGFHDNCIWSWVIRS
jgi:hypothetical protein